MKSVSLVLAGVCLSAVLSGCVYPSPEPLYLERFCMFPSAGSLEPLRVQGMLAPGIIPVWRELDNGTLFSLFQIGWRPIEKLSSEQVVFLTEYMFFERILSPVWGKVGIGDKLAQCHDRLNRLVNGRLYTEGFDTAISIELIGVELVDKDGGIVFTWGKKISQP